VQRTVDVGVRSGFERFDEEVSYPVLQMQVLHLENRINCILDIVSSSSVTIFLGEIP
jgi:hypothetical protein